MKHLASSTLGSAWTTASCVAKQYTFTNVLCCLCRASIDDVYGTLMHFKTPGLWECLFTSSEILSKGLCHCWHQAPWACTGWSLFACVESFVLTLVCPQIRLMRGPPIRWHINWVRLDLIWNPNTVMASQNPHTRPLSSKHSLSPISLTSIQLPASSAASYCCPIITMPCGLDKHVYVTLCSLRIWT